MRRLEIVGRDSKGRRLEVRSGEVSSGFRNGLR